jgi:Uma2 family endonuclease
MTLAEFLEWDSGDPSGRRWQLVDGEPVPMAVESTNFGTLWAETSTLLANHLVNCGSTCRVAMNPSIIPSVRSHDNLRIANVGVTASSPRGTLEFPDPVLLVELLSPNNHREVRANIWTYTTLPSVQEILVVHSTRIEAELLRRLPDVSWPAQPSVLHDGDALALETIGLTLPVRAMYRTTSLLG